MEKLLKSPLLTAIQAAGDLSEPPYGFRRGIYTINAIKEVINAFNSAKWMSMIQSLEYKFRVPKYLLRMIEDYLKELVLHYEAGKGTKSKGITSGAAQTSVLGKYL